MEIRYLKERKLKKSLVKKGLVAGTLGMSLIMGGSVAMPVEPTRVEAAKDRKKPKIKFKGAKTLTAEEGEQVTIPATTYSDNKTKKKKLKVGVTVKKGKKNYKALASKIKKATLKSKPVSVTFDEEGTYKITTTVTDLAKNKATATRTVTITPEQIEEQEVIIKQDPEVTTEQTRKTVTTEQPVTEEPKKENENFIDISNKEYVDYKYPFATSANPSPYDLSSDNEAYDVTITFENDYECLCVDRNSESTKNGEFIKYLGKITAIDSNGNDVSDTIVIGGLEYFQRYLSNAVGLQLPIFAKDSSGKNVCRSIQIRFIDKEDLSEYQYLISKDPKVYGRKSSEYSLNDKKDNNKKLRLINNKNNA